MRKIPAFKYYFPAEEIDRISQESREILETNGFLSSGKYCEELEKNFAEYVGAKYATTCSGGTSALELMFRSLGVEGKDVIIPTNTFGATVFGLVHAGGAPVFADCLPDLTIDPEDVAKRITPNTVAIVTVHIGGVVSPGTEALVELAKEKGIVLLEDAAHGHGSKLGDKFAGTFGLSSSFSFFSTKVMTTGEGGIFVTDQEDLWKKAALLKDQAKVNNQNLHEEIGYNWRMTEFQAILGLSQLRTLEESIAKRTAVAKIYDEGFKDCGLLTQLDLPDTVRQNYYKYTMILDPSWNREDLKQTLRNDYGVAMGGYVYDMPCHEQPAFKQWRRGDLPVAADLCARHICPPDYPAMTEDDATYVVESIRKVLG